MATTIVPDTNVLVSATFWTGDAFKVMTLIDEGRLICCLCPGILEEYERVLRSGEIAEKMEDRLLGRIRAHAEGEPRGAKDAGEERLPLRGEQRTGHGILAVLKVHFLSIIVQFENNQTTLRYVHWNIKERESVKTERGRQVLS